MNDDGKGSEHDVFENDKKEMHHPRYGRSRHAKRISSYFHSCELCSFRCRRRRGKFPAFNPKGVKKSPQPFFRHLSAFSLRIATTKTKRVFAAVSIGEKKLSPNDTRFCVSYLPHIEIRHKSEFSPLLIFTFDSWLGRVICCTRF